jgi:hypothetical protein
LHSEDGFQVIPGPKKERKYFNELWFASAYKLDKINRKHKYLHWWTLSLQPLFYRSYSQQNNIKIASLFYRQNQI